LFEKFKKLFVFEMLSMMDVFCFVKKNGLFWPRVAALLFLAFLSHRQGFPLNILLYWRQKFRLAASWENDGIGSAGNIVKQAVELPVVVCSVELYIVAFMFFPCLIFNHIWAWPDKDFH
jgi:hypothetical protein